MELTWTQYQDHYHTNTSPLKWAKDVRDEVLASSRSLSEKIDFFKWAIATAETQEIAHMFTCAANNLSK